MSIAPVVSVIVPCHNERTLLRRALRSILAQEFRDGLQIVLVDDGSTDGSADLARAEIAAAGRADVALCIVRHEGAQGNALAFCAGLRAATGQFYHVLDGDDYWIDPAKIARQVATLRAEPDLSGVGHRTLVRDEIDGSETVAPAVEPPRQRLGVEEVILGDVYLHTSSLLYRNHFRDPVSGEVRLPAILSEVRGDMVRFMLHVLQGEVRYLPVTMSVYDTHGAGIWTGIDWAAKEALMHHLYARFEANGHYDDLPPDQVRAALRRKIEAIGAWVPATLRATEAAPDRSALTGRPRRLIEVSRLPSLRAMEEGVSTDLAAGQPARALRRLVRFATALAADRNLARLGRWRRLPSREVDWHAARVGEAIARLQGVLPAGPHPASVTAGGPFVAVVSGLGPDDLGLRAALDHLLEVWRGERPVVVVSTETHPSPPAAVAALVEAGVRVMVNTDPAPEDKVGWLVHHLQGVRAAQIVALPGPTDIPLIAGLRRTHAPRILVGFGEGAGLLPGLFLPTADGIVLRRPKDAAWARQVAPRRGLAWLPRCARGDLAAGPAAGPLVTATAASAAVRVEAGYDYPLWQVVPRLLAAGAERHVHLGPLSDATRHRLAKGLDRAGIAPDRLELRPWGAGLRAAGATLYLTAGPVPEADPLLEAMAEGLAVAVHRSYLTPAFTLDDLAPAGAPLWATPEDLAPLVALATADWREVQGRAGLARAAELARMAYGAAEAAPIGWDEAGIALPDTPMPESPHELRRLMTEITGLTVFA